MQMLGTIVIALLLASPSTYVQTGLELEVTLSKTDYLLGEPVQAGISLRNVGFQSIRNKGNIKLRVILRNQSGKQIAKAGPPLYNYLPSIDQLDPNQEEYRVIELNRHFGNGYSVATAHHYFDVGGYVLQVELLSDDIQLKKTEVSFEVLEPSDSEKQVYDSFVDLVMGKANGKYSDLQEAHILESLRNRYPNSVYLPIILVSLDVVYDVSLKDHSKALETRKQLVEECPWSVRAYAAVDGILDRMATDSERMDYLKRLHARSKGTLMEKVAERRLEKNWR